MRTFILDGRLGGDAQVALTPTGKKCVKFSLANNIFNKKTKQSDVEWFEIISYSDTVINNASHLTKGRYIIVNGRLVQPKGYVDKTGKIKVNLQVVGDSIDFPATGIKAASDASQKQTISTGVTLTTDTVVAPQPMPVSTPTAAPAAAPAMATTSDDDLPF